MLQGNHYKLWIINVQNQVCYIDDENQVNAVSEEGFASDIAISEGGVIWALTSTPDPDGGGAEIAWLDRHQTWHTITNDSGAFEITGGREDQCVFRTSSGTLHTIDTQGLGRTICDTHSVRSMDCGGGRVWALLSDRTGGIPQLHYAEYSESLQWNKFAGIQNPTSISVNDRGECTGIQGYMPFEYQLPGGIQRLDARICPRALQVSFKSNRYLLSAHPTRHGNAIYEWNESRDGFWMDTGLKGKRILSTYYSNPSGSLT